MWQERVKRYILPGSIEQDPEFRAEIQRLSHIGLRVTGGLEIAASAFMVSSYMVLNPSSEMAPTRLTALFIMVSIGAITLLAAQIQSIYRFARAIALLSALMCAAALIGSMIALSQFDPTAEESIPGNLTLMVLSVTAALPLRPTDMLVFGFLIQLTYVALSLLAESIYNLGKGVEPITVLFIFMLTCVASALAALIYNQRRTGYEWHLRTLETAEQLRKSEARNLLSENAASVGRLAAAISHELNSPIGALVSGVDTLLLLASRHAHAPPSDRPRLLLLQNELRKSIQQSTDRLRETVTRMQRFSNLDAAEVQAADVNELIKDVAALLEPRYRGKIELQMDLQPVPPLVCRPQQISAVFSNLMGNAIEFTYSGGLVMVSSRQCETTVEVTVADTGRGLSAMEITTIFDPGFRVAQGRMAAGNWSMFSSRQIIREHGGEIHIRSEQGKGTRVSVVLPVN